MAFKSFQDLYTDCGVYAVDTDASSVAFFKKQLNTGILKAYSVLDAEHFYGTHTDATVDGTNSYLLPYNCDKVVSLKVTVASVDYVAVEFPAGENAWIALTGGSTSSESSYPTYFYVKKETYEIYPTPSTDSYVMTMRHKKRTKALTATDYTTGAIATATNGSTVIVGGSTSWPASVAGRFFRVNDDGYWYEVASRTSTTQIVLSREYGGSSISGGTSAYTIGEGSLLPFDFQEIPIDYTLWQYFLLKEKPAIAREYQAKWLEGLADLKSYGSSRTTSGIIGEDVIIPYYPDWPTDLAQSS